MSGDLLEWADTVMVMDKKQQRQLKARYAGMLKDKCVVCLGIPDRYEYMQAELQMELRAKVLPWLRAGF